MIDRRFLAGMVVCASVGLCSSCATDGLGTLYADVWHTGDAETVRVHVFGLQVRLRRDDLGVTLGGTERIYVFETDGQDTIPLGRSLFHIRLPDQNSLITATRTFGLELSATPPEYGITLGVRQQVAMARVPAGDSVAFTVRMDLDALENTSVSISRVGSLQ